MEAASPERWTEIENVLDPALEQAPEGRAAFLDQACGADAALRAEVERLLEAVAAAASFLDEPAPAYAAPLVARLTRADLLAPGERLGAYEVVRELGRGGMATVYLARDLRHERYVALKVLHLELAASVGPERFLREIRTTARLQHPHILTVLDSGEAAGQLWFTMPFVEGESLRDRLRRERQLPIGDAVRIAREAALALQDAHAHGIIHRDVKPENMLLTADGSTLVADFGIARALGGSDERLTGTGVSVGTPAYMSPEQAAGEREVDARSDLYALGCVLYEMLAGQSPFTGPTPRAVLARHAVDPVPPLRTVRPSVPVAVERAIGRALAKVPADRYPTARAFADALVDASETSVGSRGADAAAGRTPAPSGGTIRLTEPGITSRAIIVAGIVLAAGMLGLLWHSRTVARPRAGPRQTQLTFVGNADRQEISPDGQLLAYVERGESLRVLVKDLTGNSVIPIATFGDIWTLRWSPDGTTILCVGTVGNGRLVAALYPRLGGTPRLLPLAHAHSVLSKDGARLALWNTNTSSGMVITMLATGASRSISLSENLGWLYEGDWSPNGRWIALLSISQAGNRWVLRDINPDTGGPHEVVSDTVPLSAPRWSPAGDALYYLRDQNELRKIAITPQGAPRGAPEILQTGLGATHFSITADGTRLAYTKEQRQSNLWFATLSGAHARFTTTQLTRGSAEKTPGHLSPDGRLVAFLQRESGGADVYVIPAEGGVPRRVTSTGTATMDGSLGPAWSPDGRHLAFLATYQGKNRVQTAAVEGGDERIYERTEASEDGDLAWAPHERILYSRVGNRNYHWLDPETETEEPLVANDSVGWMGDLIPSPDGQHVAVWWNRPDRDTYRTFTYVISLRDASQAPVGPRNTWPRGWSADNTSVYVEDESGGRMHRVPLHGGQGAMVAMNPFKDATCNMTERPSGLVLLCKVDNSISDVWLVENFDPTVALR